MHLRLVACLSVMTAFAPLCASAEQGEETNALLDALGLPEIVGIMREEGMSYGEEMAMDLIPGGATKRWMDEVSAIYDTDTMANVVRHGFAESFGDTDPAPLLEYFRTAPGDGIVDKELAARRALIDDGVEGAAREAFNQIDGSSDPRLGQITRFVQANDLVNENVVGALNASYQFYIGLVDGGALEMSEEDILTEVWASEPETRADTREWLYAYLLLAYGPLTDREMRDYVKLSGSPEGKAMNRALFEAFNGMYDGISYALGRAAAQQMMAQDL